MLTLQSMKARAAMRRLANTDEGFNDILKWLQLEQQAITQVMGEHHSDVVVRQHQGAYQLLNDLFKQVDESKR